MFQRYSLGQTKLKIARSNVGAMSKSFNLIIKHVNPCQSQVITLQHPFQSLSYDQVVHYFFQSYSQMCNSGRK